MQFTRRDVIGLAIAVLLVLIGLYFSRSGSNGDPSTAATTTTSRAGSTTTGLSTTTAISQPTTTEATTTTTQAATTTTQAATTTTGVDTLAVARPYLNLIATGRKADAGAAAASTTGPASWYALYLQSLPETDPLPVTDIAGGLALCPVDDDCIEYTDFVTETDGILTSMAIDGVPLEQRIWNPEDLNAWLCWSPVTPDCAPANRQPDDGTLWLVPKHAYITAEGGSLTIVLDIETGESDFLLPATPQGILQVAAVNMSGEEFEFDWCYEPDDVNWLDDARGPYLPAGTQGLFACDFYDFAVVPQDTAMAITFSFEWGGAPAEFEFFLSDLPG